MGAGGLKFSFVRPGKAGWSDSILSLGWLLLPRGLLGPSTSIWLYDLPQTLPSGRSLEPLSLHFGFDAEALFRHLPILRLADGLWGPRFEGVRLPPRTNPTWFEARLRVASMSEDVFPLGRFLRRVDAVARAIQLDADRPRTQSYIPDIFEHGLCAMLVAPSTRATPGVRQRRNA